MKTKEELIKLKAEVEALNKKLAELSEEELEQVTGGSDAGLMESDQGVSGIIEKLMEAIREVKEKAAKQS